MNSKEIYVDINNLKNSLELMQKEKNNLVDLISRVKISYENFKNANLSGKTYDESLLNCEYFVNQMNARCQEIENMIVKLRGIYIKYQEFFEKTNVMVGDKNGTL